MEPFADVIFGWSEPAYERGYARPLAKRADDGVGEGGGLCAGGAALGWNGRGNVDLRLAGGYGTGGPSAAALLTVALR